MSRDDQIKLCLDKFVEVSKARLTIGIALALAFVTLTGYAFQNKQTEIFLATAGIPVLLFCIDILIKRAFSTPFMYKALALEIEESDIPITLLVLEFAESRSHYREIFEIDDEVERQRLFRKKFLRRGIPLR